MPTTGRPSPASSGPTLAMGGTMATMAPVADDTLASTSPFPGAPDRYEDRGRLGVGGMGEVRRVWDRQLDRHLAMKVLKPEVDLGSMRQRFLAEAKLTAQLQHPGIVAVHDQGVLADGRIWFTMREVHGRTFHELIRAVHDVSSGKGEWRVAEGEWTFRRLIAVFESVCETMAYAHSQWVVHRDLKPRNIMVGEFGEVQVMDWGLARRVGEGAREGIAGTPGYMSPEQIQQAAAQFLPPTDVFALGAILYEILVGVAPYPPGKEGLHVTLAGPPPPPPRRVSSVHPPLPDELVTLCMQALRTDPTTRPSDASVLARQVRAWLDGVRRREEAVEAVRRAEEGRAAVEGLRDEAARLMAEGRLRQSEVLPTAPEEDRWEAWALEDRARALAREADLADLAYVQALQGALEVDPTAPEPHVRLAAFYRARLVEAERAGDRPGADRASALLERHDRGQHAAFLRGDGAVTLLTDPPGADVDLYRYEERHRALVPVYVGPLGRTPLLARQLPRGSYLLVLRAAGHRDVAYPVAIGRQEHWDGVPPGGSAPEPIRMPRDGELGEGDVYVPAGWFTGGGDPEATESTVARRLWVDGFVVRRFPVTCAEYLAWLDGLAAEAGLDAATAMLPGSSVVTHESRPMRWERDRHVLGADSAGRRWQADWPVTCIDWAQARAYAAGCAARDGVGWRLPADLEREKAGRGVDARHFPWGDWGDPGRSCTQRSHVGTPVWVPVSSYPMDVSPYGVRGLAGNVRDWCLNAYSRPGDQGPRASWSEANADVDWIYVRGGSWTGGVNQARLAGRLVARPADRLTNLGMRLVRSFRPS